MTYVYSNLDLVRVVDRLGFTNSFAYDSIRRRISATDSNGHVTRYGYCNCGGVAWITNALSQVTQFVYDNQGNAIDVKGVSPRNQVNRFDWGERQSVHLNI